MNIDHLSINTLRLLSIEQITKAKSGHPGIALGAAPIIHTLYTKSMKINPLHADWIDRDRFILAAGHGSALLYSVLHLAGYDLTIDDLKNFRQFNSRTPGHPENHITHGVDATSGPLGQGIPEGVGLAIAEEFLGAKYNKENLNLIDHYTFVLCGDGDLQEGVTQEAISLAGHLALNKLIVLYDSNDIQLDGRVDASNTESVKDKFQSMLWNHILVRDGEEIKNIEMAINLAKKSNKPTIIEIKTIIGHGSSVANTSKAHGSPLNPEEVIKIRKEFGGEEFSINQEVYDFYAKNVLKKGEESYQEWLSSYEKYQQLYPQEAAEFEKIINDEFIINLDQIINFDENYNKATRVSSGEILNAIGKIHPTVIGGSADLSSSTKAKGADGDFSKQNRLGRNINFGVREHAMAAITNGIAMHKGLKPFASGFFVFSDYMKPALRLASIMELPVIYVFTHDSIAVGEDGPTHQPIEQLTMLRSIPNFNTIRPADAQETLEAWKIALASNHTPTAIILTRQDVNPVVMKSDAYQAQFGGYILAKEQERLDGVLIASGSEVSLALRAKAELLNCGIDVRVVSIPSINIFENQTVEYKNKVIPFDMKNKLAIEMSDAIHLYKYVAPYGRLLNLQTFGMSAPANVLVEHFGFNVSNVVNLFKDIIKQNK